MRLLLILILIAPSLRACCPVDQDSFADEVPDISLLNEIAGMLPHNPPEYWQARLQKVEQNPDNNFEQSIEKANCLDQLNRQQDGLDALESWKGQRLETGQAETLKTTTLQLAMDLWWRGGGTRYPPVECLRIARESLAGPDRELTARVISWAETAAPADSARYLPDFFALRFATDKTIDHDTGELAVRGLENAEDFLLAQMRRHPAWNNFDTIYALNLLYVVSGRQNLAYYARLRCWEMHKHGQYSRVPGAAEIPDIKPLTILRQERAGVLVPVKVVSDENQLMMETQFNARHAYAARWTTARSEYAIDQLAAGTAPDDPAFWKDFMPPAADLPDLKATDAAEKPETTHAIDTPVPNKPDAEDPAEVVEKHESDRTVTWITLSVLGFVLLLGALLKASLNKHERSEPTEESA